MSSDTSLWIEYKEGRQWKYIEKYHFSYHGLPGVLAKIVESRSRLDGAALSQVEILNRLPAFASTSHLSTNGL